MPSSLIRPWYKSVPALALASITRAKTKLKTLFFRGGQLCSEAEIQVSFTDLDNKPLMVSRIAHEQSTLLLSKINIKFDPPRFKLI